MRTHNRATREGRKAARSFIERQAKREYAAIGGNPRSVRFKRMSESVKRRGL